MNETRWLSGSEGDAMFEFAADRLTPRQWILLSAASVRRLWDLLPQGILREAVEAVELAVKPLTAAQRTAWLKKINTAAPAAIRAAELAQREIVKSADPDSANLENPVLERPTQSAPAFPLFRAASNHARLSIERITEAMTHAIEAVRRLFQEPTEETFNQVRGAVSEASETRVRANQAMNDSLKLKQEGDETADRATNLKARRIEESKAIEFVRRIEESRQQADDWAAEERREKASRKQMARLLRELVGNPFKPPRFEAAWRTSTVVELARSIFADRAFDRLPVLADALLDADCDEEQVLRHCRGTELGLKEPVQHIRGCWVVELVLGRWSPLPPLAPGEVPRRRPRADEDDEDDDFDLGIPPDEDDDTRLA